VNRAPAFAAKDVVMVWMTSPADTEKARDQAQSRIISPSVAMRRAVVGCVLTQIAARLPAARLGGGDGREFAAGHSTKGRMFQYQSVPEM